MFVRWTVANIRLFPLAEPWIAARLAFLAGINSWSANRIDASLRVSVCVCVFVSVVRPYLIILELQKQYFIHSHLFVVYLKTLSVAHTIQRRIMDVNK
jgi:hypothetical protein